MVHVRRDHEHAGFLAGILRTFDGHLLQFQDVNVVELFEEFDLSQSRDGKAILFIVHENLLQCDESPSLFRPRLRDFTECAFAQFTHVLIFCDF